MDPLEEARRGGQKAALSLMEDTERQGDIHYLVEAIRTAALNDTKYNYHLLQTVAEFAMGQWQEINDPTKQTG